MFTGFLWVGLLGFGGVLPFARRMIVDDRRWLTAAEFTDLLALCQFLPGPNICNMTIALGRRFQGFPGAMASILGLMGAPVLIAIGLGLLYARFGAIPAVAHLFAGLAAAASGLVLATAIKVGAPLLGRVKAVVIAAVAFALLAGLRTPLLPTMLLLAPVSVWLHRSAAGARKPA
jgi:chromate transporter